MSFFSKLFGAGRKADPIPKRPLRLQFAPAPENAHVFASQFVEVIRNNDRFQLDYSEASIQFVDRFLQRFNDAGITANNFAETIFVAGAYVGQVLVQHRGAAWVKLEEVNSSIRQGMMPIVIKLPNGNFSDPITQAFRRFSFGKKEDLQLYYQQLTGYA